MKNPHGYIQNTMNRKNVFFMKTSQTLPRAGEDDEVEAAARR